MTEEIKPCPLCGSEAHLYHYNDGRGYSVQCTNPSCFVCGPTDSGTYAPIQQWNTRPLESQQADRILQLEQELAAATGRVTGLEQAIEETKIDAAAMAGFIFESQEGKGYSAIDRVVDKYRQNKYPGWYELCDKIASRKIKDEIDAYIDSPDFLALAQQKRARRAAEAGAGAKGEQG